MGSDSTTIHITPSISLPPVLGGIGISAMGTVASGDQRLVVSTWRPERPGWRLPSAALSRFAPSVRDQLPLGYSSATRSAQMQQCPARSACTAGPRPQDPFPVAERADRTSPLGPTPVWGERLGAGDGPGPLASTASRTPGETEPRPSVITAPIDAGGADLSRTLPSRRDLATVVQGSTHGSGGRPGRLCRIASGLSGLCQRQLNDNPPLLPLVVGVHAGERAAEQLAGRRVQYESKVAGTASSRRPVLLYT
jgi:hypothetical protein